MRTIIYNSIMCVCVCACVRVCVCVCACVCVCVCVCVYHTIIYCRRSSTAILFPFFPPFLFQALIYSNKKHPLSFLFNLVFIYIYYYLCALILLYMFPHTIDDILQAIIYSDKEILFRTYADVF
jgi:hypothetical protein